jgi:hypothetical protein
MKTKHIFLFVTVLIFAGLPAHAQRGTRKAAANAATGSWVLLAEKTVNYNTDKDYVYPAGNDWYNKIYFKVTVAPIQINSIVVYFENGESFNVSIRSKIQENGQSRVIDLPAGERRIKRIELSYETMGSNRGRANVAVWGRK